MYYIILISILSVSSSGVLAALISFEESEIDIDRDLTPRDSILERCRGSEIVDVSGMGLSKIPDRFINSDNIRAVSLENNAIREVSSGSFVRVKNLKCLNLAYNQLNMKNMSNFGHERLQMLNLGYQNQRPHYNTIEPFDLYDIYREESSEYLIQDTGFPNLELLDISGNRMKYPENTFRELFPRLTHLYMMDQAARDVSPSFFEQLPSSVLSLHLERNVLNKFSIANMPYIKNIYLDGNPLSSTGLSFVSKELSVLCLSKCSLAEINPKTFAGTPNLVRLDLSDNLLKELSQDVFAKMPSLKYLSLSGNALSQFPSLMGLDDLVSLSLSHNRIKSIFQKIPLTSLQKLNLKNNSIHNINDVAFSQLTALEELDLSENRLTQLHYTWMSSLPNLRYLDLRSNEFSNMHSMYINASSRLVDLFIKSKSLSVIQHKELEVLSPHCVVHVV